MKIEEQLRRIEILLNQSEVFQTDEASNEIQDLLLQVFDELSVSDFENSGRIRQWLFNFSDDHQESFWAHLYLLLNKQLKGIFLLPQVLTNENLETTKSIDVAGDFLLKLMESYMSQGANRIRLSESIILPSEIPSEMRQDLFLFIIRLVQHDASSYKWQREDILAIYLPLVIGRHLAILIDRVDLFYGLLGTVIQRMNISQEYQLCRDFAEEVLLISLIDNKREWGYLSLFQAFNGQRNTNMAFLYANACVASLKQKQALPDLVIKRFLFTYQRLLRDIGFIDREISLYEYLLKHIALDPFDVFDVTNTHLMSLLRAADANVVTKAYEYIVNNREFIFQSGKSIAAPLLNTLYQVKRNFDGHPDINSLSPYIDVLESILGKSDVEQFRSRVLGDSNNLKSIYIRELFSLHETRNIEDFVSEVHDSLVMAEMLINFSFNYQDIDSFLLAMILRTDYSWAFPNNRTIPGHSLREIGPKQPDKKLLETYENYSEHIRTGMDIRDKDVCIWLAKFENHVFCLSLMDNRFAGILAFNDWTLRIMQKWLDRMFDDLSFDLTYIKGGQVHQYLEEDQERDRNNVKDALSFTKTDTLSARGVLLVRDMALSGLPHNLLLDSDGEFIAHKKPIACLPSAEWYIADKQRNTSLKRDFTTSLWIPTERGDYALNLLWSNLSAALKDFNVKVSNSEIPKEPLCADINILSAHGDTNIPAFHALFTSEKTAIAKIGNIVADGRIIILFVCHSGSIKKDLFRQMLLSVVRRFIENGYQAVIAPFWSLHISIPPVWLPEFLESMQKGSTVSEAVFNANYRVHETNKNPGAWACLHLYGNPYLRVE